MKVHLMKISLIKKIDKQIQINQKSSNQKIFIYAGVVLAVAIILY